MAQRDISILDLDEGQLADIHTDVWVGGVRVSNVSVRLMVLEAEDGHLKLLVDQITRTDQTVRLKSRTSERLGATVEDPG